MKKLWQNIIFKFAVLLATVISLISIELYIHINTTNSLKETSFLLSVSKKSIENILEADRDAYQSNLAVITSIQLKLLDRNNAIDSFRAAAYENIRQIDGRFKTFRQYYVYKNSSELEMYNERFQLHYARFSELTDSIFNFLEENKTVEAFRFYYNIYLENFYPLRKSMDQITDLHYAESEKYAQSIQQLNEKLKYRTYFSYSLLVIIFIIVTNLSGKSIIKRTKYIQNLTKTLSLRNEELSNVNNDLNKSNKELEIVNREIQTSNEELNTLNDILADQKKQLEDALSQVKQIQLQSIQAEKNAAIGILIAGLAHEINNPVNFITSGVSALEEFHKKMALLLFQYKGCATIEDFQKIQIKANVFLADPIFEKLEKLNKGIHDGSKRIYDLVQNINLHHQGKEIIEQIDIHDAINFCIDLELHTPNKNLAFVKKYGKTPKIDTNFKNLCQIINVITKNAIDAIEKNGSITFATGSNDDQVYVSITDTGCGIGDNEKDKIFDPFYTTKPVGKGSGLGLFIARDLIKKAGGSIIVDTEVGIGSTFTIFFPKKNEATQEAKIINNNYTF